MKNRLVDDEAEESGSDVNSDDDENKDGEINKVLVQGETDKKTTDYTSLVFGTLYGISYDSLKN